MTAANEFLASAPEFAWVDNTACNTSPSNCISVKVVDSSAGNDSQGVELAVYSAKTRRAGTRWTSSPPPTTLAPVTPGVPFSIAGHVPTGATTAGVFYGMKTGAAAQAALQRRLPVDGECRVQVWTELLVCSEWELIGTTI